MNDVASWATLWGIVLAVGLGLYYLIVLVVVPLGARDIRRLFKQLDAQEEPVESESPYDGHSRRSIG